jgi:hypothetical protein
MDVARGRGQKKERAASAGGGRWSMVLWTCWQLKADVSKTISFRHARTRMCGWSRQGRTLDWCQEGEGAGVVSPFQRSCGVELVAHY